MQYAFIKNNQKFYLRLTRFGKFTFVKFECWEKFFFVDY